MPQSRARMELRLIQIRLPRSAEAACRESLDGAETLAVWHEPALDQQMLVRDVTATAVSPQSVGCEHECSGAGEWIEDEITGPR